MRREAWIGGVVAVLWLASACAATPAILGSQFADVCTAFAPLRLLHRSYADHLFAGAPLSVPAGVEDACADFAQELARFHLEYLLQTESVTAGAAAFLVRLRAEAATYCDAHAAAILAIARTDGADLEIWGAAAEAGLFAGIKRMNDGLEGALDELLLAMGEDERRWAFGVAFALRSLLRQGSIERIGTGLREILYGDAAADGPPHAIAPDVALAMEQLLGLTDRELTTADLVEAIRTATIIYEHFLSL